MQLTDIASTQQQVYLLGRENHYFPLLLCTGVDGEISWQKGFARDDNRRTLGAAICCSEDSVFLAQTVGSDSFHPSTLQLSAFSDQGSLQWQRQYADGLSGQHCDLAWHPAGHLVVGGEKLFPTYYQACSYWLELSPTADLLAGYTWFPDFEISGYSHFSMERIAVSPQGQMASVGSCNSHTGGWVVAGEQLIAGGPAVVNAGCTAGNAVALSDDPAGLLADWLPVIDENSIPMNFYAAHSGE